MPLLGIFSWSQYTTPAGIPQGNLTGDTHPNDPNPSNPGHDPDNPVSWIGETFTFNGGTPLQVDVADDDGNFEDGYVETGSAQTLAQDITIDGTTYLAGSTIENEFSLINGSGQEIYVVRINGKNVGFAYGSNDAPTSGETFTATDSLDGSPADNADGSSSSSEPYAGIMCFTSGTRIATPNGPRRVEALRIGELVTTKDEGPQPVIWTGHTDLDLTEATDRFRPILIRAGCFGMGVPQRDLVVSPHHRMVLSAPLFAGTRAEPEVFAPAKGLLPARGIRTMRGRKSVSYHHILLPAHSVIYAEGAATESFFPGKVAMGMLAPDQRRDILRLFPALRQDPAGGYGPLARNCLTARQARTMSERWRHNACAFLELAS